MRGGENSIKGDTDGESETDSQTDIYSTVTTHKWCGQYGDDIQNSLQSNSTKIDRLKTDLKTLIFITDGFDRKILEYLMPTTAS